MASMLEVISTVVFETHHGQDDDTISSSTQIGQEPNHLEFLINSIVMFVVEGRRSTASSCHNASYLFERLMTAVSTEAASSDMTICAPLRYECPKFVQCQIASKLKSKIEKCMKEHLSVFGLNNHHARHRSIVVSKKQKPVSSEHHYYHHRSLKDTNELKKKLNYTQVNLSSPLPPYHHHSANHAPVSPPILDELLCNTPTTPLSLNSHHDSLDSSTPHLEDAGDEFLDGILLDQLISRNLTAQSRVVIDVYLLAECCFNELCGSQRFNSCPIIDLARDSQPSPTFELLERWTFSMITSSKVDESPTNSAKSLLKVNELVQAIRSYLHFSQISSWSSQTPVKNIAFSISSSEDKSDADAIEPLDHESPRRRSSLPTGEFDSQTFPLLSLLFSNNKLTAPSNTSTRTHASLALTRIRVDLESRKRSTLFGGSGGIPTLVCFNHNKQCSSSSLSEPIFGMNKSVMSSQPVPILSPTISSACPFWSSLVSPESPSGGEPESPPRRSTMIALSLLTPATTPQNQPPASKSLLLTTPTQFPGLVFGAPTSPGLTMSQSPKVLVSNHQLLLTADDMKQLNLHDQNNNSDSVSDHNDENDREVIEPVTSFKINLNKRKFQLHLNSTSRSNDPHHGAPNDSPEKTIAPKSIRIDEDDEPKSAGERTPNKKPTRLCLNQLAETTTTIAESECDTTLRHNSVSTPCFSSVNGGECNNKQQPQQPVKPKVINKSTRCYFQLSSSPAPLRKSGSSFDFDKSLKDPKSIKNALTQSNGDVIKQTNKSVISPLVVNGDEESTNSEIKPEIVTQVSKCESDREWRSMASVQLSYSNTHVTTSSMPIIPNCLLGSFEESLLNGRMNPVGIVDGFYAEIGASGSFFPEHVTLPVYAAFYQVCEDVAASPYLGIINLGSIGKRGYRVPTKGTIQVTLFNPNKTVVKMFVVMYDLSDMPASHRTFLRQRTMYVPLKSSGDNEDEDDSNELKSYLRYLIHLRFSTSKSGKMYLHTNIKLIFARNKCEIDPRLARYEYKTFTEAPKSPKYSPKR